MSLAVGEQGLELRVDLDDVAMPVAVQTALQARLGRLNPQTRAVATICAAVGRTFGTSSSRSSSTPRWPAPPLLELQRLDLIAEERRRPAPEYRFRHGLVQEVAYASMLEHDRRDAHRRIAEALEALAVRGRRHAARAGAGPSLAEADMPREAADALIDAGDKARGMWATAEAVEDYRRARTFLARLGEERALSRDALQDRAGAPRRLRLRGRRARLRRGVCLQGADAAAGWFATSACARW